MQMTPYNYLRHLPQWSAAFGKDDITRDFISNYFSMLFLYLPFTSFHRPLAYVIYLNNSFGTTIIFLRDLYIIMVKIGIKQIFQLVWIGSNSKAHSETDNGKLSDKFIVISQRDEIL